MLQGPVRSAAQTLPPPPPPRLRPVALSPLAGEPPRESSRRRVRARRVSFRRRWRSAAPRAALPPSGGERCRREGRGRCRERGGRGPRSCRERRFAGAEAGRRGRAARTRCLGRVMGLRSLRFHLIFASLNVSVAVRAAAFLLCFFFFFQAPC